jgi:hypothetical protein
VPVVALTGDPVTGVVEDYRLFAREVRGRSAAYESLAGSVADDAVIVAFVAALPPAKRQPNLLFAAARYLLGVPPGIEQLRELVSQSPAELAEVMLSRRTQTNEPARCATLLPALAQLPQPLALIEAGASAGLTLLFDRYSYDYGGHRLAGLDPDAPTLRCEPRGPVPLPARMPAIAWRAGLDLNPLDVTSDDDVRWLSCLVWPPAAILPPCTAATCSPTCPHWPPRRHPARRWSSTTPPSSTRSLRTSGNSSPGPFAPWAPPGWPAKHPVSRPEWPPRTRART